MAENYSGKALFLEEGESLKIFIDNKLEKHFILPKKRATFHQDDDWQNVDLGNGMPLRFAGVNFDLPGIPGLPDAIGDAAGDALCDIGITAYLAVDPMRTIKQLINAERAAGRIGKVDTTEFSKACEDKAKAFAVLAKFSILEPQAATAFEIISKLGRCCPRFYERLLNED